MSTLPSLGRFRYSGLRDRPVYDWPNGARVAVHVALNVEHFIFGEGGVDLDRPTPPPNHRSYLWREYGNRVGIWRMLDLFDEFGIPVGVIANSAAYEHCPEALAAFRERGDEVIGHGITNSKKPADMTEDEEAAMIRTATETITRHEGRPPAGWLSPYITPSPVTPDLLKEAGYRYLLDWGICDDQPFWSRTRSGPLLAVPYPLELNDQPAIVFRRDTAAQFCDALIDQLEEHLRSASRYPSVCAISLHHFIMGQPFRLRHLRRAFEHIAAAREHIWLTTPGAIAEHYCGLPAELQVEA